MGFSHDRVGDMDDPRLRARRQLLIPMMGGVARHRDTGNAERIERRDRGFQRRQRTVMAGKDRLGPVRQLRHAEDDGGHMLIVPERLGHSGQLEVEVSRCQRPETADDAELEADAMVDHRTGSASSCSDAASTGCVVSLWLGAIIAVLAATVQTLDSVMNVSTAASTATNRANAASKGIFR